LGIKRVTKEHADLTRKRLPSFVPLVWRDDVQSALGEFAGPLAEFGSP